MVALYIQLGELGWNVLVYYNVDKYDFVEIAESLMELDCPEEDLRKGLRVLRRKNTGFTFTNTDYKMSIVCIGKATEVSLFVSTAVHEAKHVLSHICAYYGIDESSEEAAYLIGYVVRRMYKMLAKILKSYV